MSSLSTPAIILRRIEYGDFDLILSFLTLEKGKLSAIAKSARKSTKRFGGILELFAALDILCSSKAQRFAGSAGSGLKAAVWRHSGLDHLHGLRELLGRAD
jgi:recombinational DNA repair protein (RecF pathway)